MILLLTILGLGVFLLKTPLRIFCRFFGWILVGYTALLVLKLLT